MKLEDVAEGQWVTRNQWDNCLFVVMKFGVFWYYDANNEKASRVGVTSEIFRHKNFVNEQPHPRERAVCYKQIAQQLPKQGSPKLKGNTMKYEEVKVIVMSNDGADNKEFAEESTAHEYIAERLEVSNRVKFTVFKPYQKIEPVKVDLSAMIVEIS